jgi:hypothetical protein
MSTLLSREHILQQPGVYDMIAERAYYIAEKTGFETGRDMDCWLQAEAELLNELNTGAPETSSITINGVTKKTTRKTAVKVDVDGVEAPAKVAKPRATRAKTVSADPVSEAKPVRKRVTKKAE